MKKRLYALLLCLFLLITCLPITVFAAQTTLKITQQPVNAYAVSGSKASTTLTAQGEDLQYQWYLKNPGQDTFHKSSVTGSTYSITMREEISGRQVYCVVTDGNGKTVASDTVTLKIPTQLKITSQPANDYCADGEVARTKVTVQGDALQYQWYLKGPDQTRFSKSTVKKDAYSFTMSAKASGRQVYCVITDCHGNSVTSQTATLKIPTPLAIEKQPANAYAHNGQKASTSVGVRGDELTYQWYLRNPGQSKFHLSSITSNQYSVTMDSERSGRQVYCVISDCHGNSVTTKTVTLKIPVDLAIKKQPESTQTNVGQKISAIVYADGDELKYQWYVKNFWQNQFYESSITQSAYSTTASAKTAGRQIYCVITDRLGNTVQTDTVTLYTTGSFAKSIYRLQPDVTKDLSAELNFTTDDILVWESSDASVAKVSSTGVVSCLKNGTATITVTGEKSSIQAQCTVVVTDAKQVALTFDDGPSAHTTRLLDFLREKNVPVTFFLVGDRINSFSSTVAQAAKDGHEIGYHSYAHKTQTDLTDAQIISDFEKSNALLQSIAGTSFTLWRTPGGNYNDRVLNCIPLPHIMWSVDTRDWENRNASSVYNAIINNSKDGSIVLLHDLYETTVDGAIRAIEKMLEDGYEFVTVTDILSREGVEPEPHTNYFRAP